MNPLAVNSESLNTPSANTPLYLRQKPMQSVVCDPRRPTSPISRPEHIIDTMCLASSGLYANSTRVLPCTIINSQSSPADCSISRLPLGAWCQVKYFLMVSISWSFISTNAFTSQRGLSTWYRSSDKLVFGPDQGTVQAGKHSILSNHL